MAKQRKIWQLAAARDDLCEKLTAELGLASMTARLLVNRGITDGQQAKVFLQGGIENLHDPLSMHDMAKAVERISLAISLKQKITIYGDYDVDGITSVVLVYQSLKLLGARVDYYVPDRQTEGYGLNTGALQNLLAAGTELLLTVDCGISAAEEISDISRQLDVIVTDHHQTPAVLPPAYAVIDPQRPDCLYPDKYLAGVGVAFKLCQALYRYCEKTESILYDFMDIVSIGTIADIVPLVGENRILVKLGLQKLPATANIGLRALLKACGLDSSNLDAGKIGFVVAPRLNAAGRLGTATTGIELLLTADETKADQLADELERENRRRQEVGREIELQAEDLIYRQGMEDDRVLVIAGEEWHIGVIGIVASRLAEKFYRPVIIISLTNGIGKGSCRSIPGFDIYRALTLTSDLLIQFGGHKQAAGLSIVADNIADFRKTLNEIAAATLTAEDFSPVLKVDAVIALREINDGFINQLASLAPYGTGNPKPIFVSYGVKAANFRSIGRNDQHLKLKVVAEGACNNVIAWEMGDFTSCLTINCPLNLAYIPEYNDWQGQRSIQLRAYDIVLAREATRAVAGRDGAAKVRALVGHIYLIIKKAADDDRTVYLTNHDIDRQINRLLNCSVGEVFIDRALTVLCELKLLSVDKLTGRRIIKLRPEPGRKLNIEQSLTFRKIIGQYTA